MAGAVAESGRFTVTLEVSACCDLRVDYRGIHGALSERFGADWVVVVLATCGISEEFPTGQFLLIKDKELFKQHMRGANLYVQALVLSKDLYSLYSLNGW